MGERKRGTGNEVVPINMLRSTIREQKEIISHYYDLTRKLRDQIGQLQLDNHNFMSEVRGLEEAQKKCEKAKAIASKVAEGRRREILRLTSRKD